MKTYRIVHLVKRHPNKTSKISTLSQQGF